MVALCEPLINEDLGVLCFHEALCIKNVPTEFPIDPLVVSILPWRCRIDADRPRTSAKLDQAELLAPRLQVNESFR